jgi:hypothetical protein
VSTVGWVSQSAPWLSQTQAWMGQNPLTHPNEHNPPYLSGSKAWPSTQAGGRKSDTVGVCRGADTVVHTLGGQYPARWSQFCARHHSREVTTHRFDSHMHKVLSKTRPGLLQDKHRCSLVRVLEFGCPFPCNSKHRRDNSRTRRRTRRFL